MMSETGEKVPLKVFFVVGEPSGDALAAKLMSGLKKKVSDQEIDFIGVGGPLMIAEGLNSLFPMDELTVMGITEVLPQIPRLLKRVKEVADAAMQADPDIFISVDAPDFSFRVAKKLTKAPFPKVHYVAPSVWAWRPGRAAKIARLYDHLLTLLPFEPPYFEREGLPATFIGHSVIETGAGHGDGVVFRKTHNLGSEAPLLMVLPGSRRSEVSRHLAIFKETILSVQKVFNDLCLVVPVIGKSAELVRNELKNWPLKAVLIDGETEKYDAMAASNVALAASGTVGLELALARLPAVIAYKMNPLTGYLARKLVKLDYVNLVNILEKREIVPEHLLEECKSKILAATLIDLMETPEKQAAQVEGYKSAVTSLGLGSEAPGERAATVVLGLIPSVGQPDSTEKKAG